MNFASALKLLHIDNNDYHNRRNNKDIIRKKYLKAALKYHPDKYHDNGEKFKEVNEAYKFLCENQKLQTEKIYEDKLSFDSIIEELVSKICPIDNAWSKLFMKTTINTIFHKCEDFSYKIFEKLSREKVIEIYDFLSKINEFDLINDTFMKKIKSIIEDKIKHDNIILLIPTLEDLLNDTVYKLDISKNIFYVPLWHNELFFDFKQQDKVYDLIVKMEPDIADNIFIDSNNDIFIKYRASIKNVFEKQRLVIKIGDKEIIIKSSEIKLTNEVQMFKYQNIGIIKINEDNIFDTSDRGSIVIELVLTK